MGDLADVIRKKCGLELNLHNLLDQLSSLTEPLVFGAALGIEQRRLNLIQANHTRIEKQTYALCQYIDGNDEFLGITWPKIADALERVDGNLALEVRGKFCGASDRVQFPKEQSYDRSFAGHAPEVMETEAYEEKVLLCDCKCGECTAIDYVKGSMKCGDNKRFLRLELALGTPLSSTEVELGYFEYHLSLQVKEIHAQFCDLKDDTFTKLKSITSDHELEFEDIRAYLSSLLDCRLFSSESEISKMGNFSALRKYVDYNCCSWFDYNLIKRLRGHYKQVFPHARDDQLLCDYESYFCEWAKCRCFLYLSDVGPSPAENRTRVKFKTNCIFEGLTTKQIVNYKYSFADVVGIPSHSLNFVTAQSGCTELFFRAPTYLEKLKKLTEQEEAQLTTHGFIRIEIGRQLFFSTTQTVTTSPGMLSPTLTQVMPRNYKESESLPLELVHDALSSKTIPKHNNLPDSEICISKCLQENTQVSDSGCLQEDTHVSDSGCLQEDTHVSDSGFKDDTQVSDGGFKDDTHVSDSENQHSVYICGKNKSKLGVEKLDPNYLVYHDSKKAAEESNTVNNEKGHSCPSHDQSKIAAKVLFNRVFRRRHSWPSHHTRYLAYHDSKAAAKELCTVNNEKGHSSPSFAVILGRRHSWPSCYKTYHDSKTVTTPLQDKMQVSSSENSQTSIFDTQMSASESFQTIQLQDHGHQIDSDTGGNQHYIYLCGKNKSNIGIEKHNPSYLVYRDSETAANESHTVGKESHTVGKGYSCPSEPDAYHVGFTEAKKEPLSVPAYSENENEKWPEMGLSLKSFSCLGGENEQSPSYVTESDSELSHPYQECGDFHRSKLHISSWVYKYNHLRNTLIAT